MYIAMSILSVAIVAEVAATSALVKTQAFTHLGWTAFVAVGYLVSAWLLSLAVRHISVSVAYAIWAGLGTALVSAVGVVLLGEHMDVWKSAALAMIIVGVVILNLRGAH